MYIRVAVNYPLQNPGLTYKAPEGIKLSVGQMVDVPLGKRKELGCVLELDVTPPEDVKLKEIHSIREDYPILRERDLKLYSWMAGYYHYGLGQLIVDCLPVAKKRPRPLKKTIGEGSPNEHSLTEQQIKIVSQIEAQKDEFSKHLIHGVTGSGKTLIFLELIKSTLAKGKSALYLLPEINLTPQFIKTFIKHVGVPVYAFHSEVTASEKYLIWKEAAEEPGPKLFIGVRSAVFLPVNNLGLVIVDEEHDSSFKQDDRCAYNARDVAVKKAQIENCSIVLGSATPSVETWSHYRSSAPKTFYYSLKERVGDAAMPEIVLVNTREESRELKSSPVSTWPLHRETIDALSSALKRGEQALVFINRLGFANYVQCRSCGHQFHCKNCTSTLRYFKAKNILSCQHCEYYEKFPEGCPKCGNITLLQKGFGTEKVQEELARLMPERKIERFDRDEIKTFTALQDKLERFHAGEIDILVGTQMLSKGHNFRKVKCVVILGVDNQLSLPDFRANERIWQTVMQVAGRAGRYSKDGKVLIQTATPESPLFDIIKKHSFDDFYQDELRVRTLCECPPAFKLIALYFTGKDQDKLTSHLLNQVEPTLRGICQQHFDKVHILGPRPALVEKRANQFSWTVLLKSQDINQLHNLLSSFKMNWNGISGISLKVDVDPQQLW